MNELVDTECSADPQRRSKNLRSTKSTNDLQRALADHGIKMSISSTYRRLQPRNKAIKYAKLYQGTVNLINEFKHLFAKHCLIAGHSRMYNLHVWVSNMNSRMIFVLLGSIIYHHYRDYT